MTDTLPAEYTCDGGFGAAALEWAGTPDGTEGYVVIMHHVPRKAKTTGTRQCGISRAMSRRCQATGKCPARSAP